MKQEIDLDLLVWQQKVDALIYAELTLEHQFKSGNINLKEKRKIKKRLNKLWLASREHYPHKNPSLEQAYKLHFG